MAGFGAKVKLSVDRSTAAKAEFNEQINSLTKQIKISNKFVVLQKDMDRVRTSAQTMLNKSPIKITNIDCSQAVTKLRKDLQNVINSLSIKNGVSITGLVDPSGVGTISTQIDNIADAAARGQDEVNRFNAQMGVLKTTMSSLSTMYKTILPGGKNAITDPTQLESIIQKYNALALAIQTANANSKNGVIASQEEIFAIQNKVIELQREIAAIEQARIAKAQAAKEDSANAKAEANAQEDLNRRIVQSNNLLNTTKKNLTLWSASKTGKTSESFRAIEQEILQIERLQQEYKDATITKEEFDAAFSNSKRVINEHSAIIKDASENTKTFTERVGGLAAKFTSWLTISQVIMQVYRALKEMVSVVVEVDTAMTELRKVTDETEATYNKFLDNAASRAKKLGATLADVVTASADFARLGFGLEDAEKLADAAIVYKNVGDGIEDISQASESIIATLQAFSDEISPDEVMLIVDKFNEVGNNFAISSEGVGEVLLRSAAAMKAANNTLDETIALAAAANTIVQNPETVGTTLKTVSMYLRAAKTEAEDAGEATDGMATSVSELREELLQLTNNKVDIQIDEDTFKSTYQILKELSEVWDELTDLTKANILEMVGGKRNANVVAALLENFTIAEAALTDSANAAGSALAENEKYLDSIEGKIANFKASFESLSTNLISSDLIKFIVDIGTGILDILNYLTQLNLLLPAIIAAVMLYKSINSAKSVSAITLSLIQQKAATESLIASVNGLTIAEKKKLASNIQAAIASGQITAAQGAQILSTIGLATAEGTLTIANKGLATSFKTLMASIPVWGWVALGISVLIEAVVAITSAVGDSSNKMQELNAEFEEITSSAQNAANKFTTLKQNADDVIPRFAELAKGVNDFGENVSLTDEEYAEFIELNNKIAEMFPELDLGLDSNGNHMLALSYSIDTLTESLYELIEAERLIANEEIAGNMGDALKNMKSADKEYEKERKRLLQRKEDFQTAFDEINRMYSEQYRYQEAYGERWEDNYQLDTSNYVAQLQSAWGSYGNETDAEAWRQMVDKYTIDEETLEIDWYKVVNSDEFANVMAGVDRQIDNIAKRQEARWQKLNPIVGAWMQTTDYYAAAEDSTQNLLSKIVGNIDYSEIGITNEKKLKEYVTNTYIKPITEAAPEVQNAMVGLFDIKSAFDSGALTVGEYGITDYILGDLEKYGVSDTILSNLSDLLGLEEFQEQLGFVKAGIVGLDEEVSDFVGGLTYEELTFAYQIIAEDGSITIDELDEKIKHLKYAGADMVEPLNLEDFVDGLNDAAGAIDKVTSAMAKLAEGTALSKKEMLDLIEQYPELLKQADIFADGSVEAQKNALQAILDMTEQEYDAQIDAKIKELEATLEVLDAQMELEEQKANIIADIKNQEVNGKITQEEDFLENLALLNDLQGRNYVAMKDGELQVNEEALNDQLAMGTEFGEKSAESIWDPLGETIVSSHEQGYTGALTATNEYTTSLWTRIKNFFSNIGSAIANAWNDMWSGNWQGIGAYFSQAFVGTGTQSINGGVVSVNFGGTKTTINGQDIDDWISEQEKAQDLRIEKIEILRTETLNAIENLEALKGLDLGTIYAPDTGSSADDAKNETEDEIKSVEEYIATIEEYYEALKRLEEVQKRRNSLEKKLANTDDLSEKIFLSSGLIDVYNEEIGAEQDLMAAKKATISANVGALRGLGFDVSYDSANNELIINNLEHLNELTATSTGEYETLQEATNALRKETESLIDATEQLNDDNVEAAENIEDLGYSILETKNNIIDYIEDIYEKQVESYQKIIDLRKELIQSAKDELDYEDEVAEKVKEIADLQARIDQLALDDSRSAQAERASLMEELAEKQKDLADTQKDHSTDAQIDALDKMAEDYEQQRADEIEIMRNTVTESEELWNAFYQTILGNNATVGASVDEYIANAWIRAAQAVNDYSAAMSGIASGGVVINSIPKYHTGGVVDESNVGKDETLALLEKGEIVLNDGKQQVLYKIIDFQTELASKLGTIIGSLTLPDISGTLRSMVSGTTENITSNNQSLVFEPHIQVDISHNGEMADTDAKNYGEQIADTAIEKLYSAFERRGISSTRGARLKP